MNGLIQCTELRSASLPNRGSGTKDAQQKSKDASEPRCQFTRVFLELSNLKLKVLNFEVRLAALQTAWFLLRRSVPQPWKHNPQDDMARPKVA